MAGLDTGAGRRHLHKLGVALVVVSLGAAGAFASLRGDQLRVPIAPTTLVDTVGAGDSFHAGLLHHLAQLGVLGGRLEPLTTARPEQALLFASRVAAINCSRPGADPPWAPNSNEPATRHPVRPGRSKLDPTPPLLPPEPRRRRRLRHPHRPHRPRSAIDAGT